MRAFAFAALLLACGSLFGVGSVSPAYAWRYRHCCSHKRGFKHWGRPYSFTYISPEEYVGSRYYPPGSWGDAFYSGRGYTFYSYPVTGRPYRGRRY